MCLVGHWQELDELEREDFTRLKKVQEKKKVRMAEEEKTREERMASRGGAAAEEGMKPDLMGGYEQDADVVF